MPRHVSRSENRMNSRNFFRHGGIHRQEFGMGVPAPKDLTVKHSLDVHVVGKGQTPFNLGLTITVRDRLSQSHCSGLAANFLWVANPARSQSDSIDDLDISGTTTDVILEGFADLLGSGFRVTV